MENCVSMKISNVHSKHIPKANAMFNPQFFYNFVKISLISSPLGGDYMILVSRDEILSRFAGILAML